MTATTTPATAPPTAPPAAPPTTAPPRVDPGLGLVGPGRWIERWSVDDEPFWNARGRAIARRNLGFSVFAEHIGFSVWLLWSIVVVSMSGTFAADGTLLTAGANGWALTAGQALTVIAVASGVGSLLRLPYTFAVPRFGGRNWTVVLALLLLVPTLLFAVAVQHPGTPYWAFVLIAATAGVGGGNFASSMANINFFYPARRKGLALGLNAAGGNIGVAVLQLGLPIVVGGAGASAWSRQPAASTSSAPATCTPRWPWSRPSWRSSSWTTCSAARSDARDVAAVVRHRHTWVMALLYIGTFGSFIGYSAALPLLIKLEFFDAAARRHRHQLRLLRLPRRPGRLDHPAVRRLAGRQVRRRPGHPGHLRRDDPRHARRAGRARAAGPEPDAGPGIATDLVLPVVPGRVPVRLRRDRHRQRLDLPDDPGDLAGAAAGTPAGRRAGPPSTGHQGPGGHRHRLRGRCGRRLPDPARLRGALDRRPGRRRSAPRIAFTLFYVALPGGHLGGLRPQAAVARGRPAWPTRAMTARTDDPLPLLLPAVRHAARGPPDAGGRRSWREFPVNEGGLCRKGWNAAGLLGHRERLTTPLVRDRATGELRPASLGRGARPGRRPARARCGPSTGRTRSRSSAAAG